MKNLFLIFVILLGSVVVYNKFYKNNATPTNPQQTELATVPLPELKNENNFSGIPVPEGINNAVSEKKTRIATAPTNTATATTKKVATNKTSAINGFDAMKAEKEKTSAPVVEKKATAKKNTEKTVPKKASVKPENEPVNGFFTMKAKSEPKKIDKHVGLIFLGRENAEKKKEPKNTQTSNLPFLGREDN